MQPVDSGERWCEIGIFGKEEKSRIILSGDSWKDERVVENSPDSQKLNISKPRIENKNQACYCIDTQMNSNICTVFIVTIHLFQTQIIGKESKMNNTTNR